MEEPRETAVVREAAAIRDVGDLERGWDGQVPCPPEATPVHLAVEGSAEPLPEPLFQRVVATADARLLSDERSWTSNGAWYGCYATATGRDSGNAADFLWIEYEGCPWEVK